MSSTGIQITDHVLTGQAASIPITPAIPIISISPVVLSTPDRIVDLQLKISAPTTGDNLPIILLAHGQGSSNYLSSFHGYGPVVTFWASHGFVVIQPTHLSSGTLKLAAETPGAPLFWQSRVEDMKIILDQLDHIETTIPFITGRLDRSRIAVVGHSMGGHTASLLLGARIIDPADGKEVNMIEPRIKAGVLLTAPGKGGADLSEFAAEKFPFLGFSSFAEMTTPTLVVTGDGDASKHLTVRGASWHADPYNLSTGPKSLLNIIGGEHLLGGISGYDANETTDEDPERVALVQRLTWAYLRTVLDPQDSAWSSACSAMEGLKILGQIEHK